MSHYLYLSKKRYYLESFLGCLLSPIFSVVFTWVLQIKMRNLSKFFLHTQKIHALKNDKYVLLSCFFVFQFFCIKKEQTRIFFGKEWYFLLTYVPVWNILLCGLFLLICFFVLYWNIHDNIFLNTELKIVRHPPMLWVMDVKKICYEMFCNIFLLLPLFYYQEQKNAWANLFFLLSLFFQDREKGALCCFT